MTFNSRPFGLAVLLLVAFLGASLALQWWVKRETRHLQQVAVEEQRTRLGRIIAVSGLPPAKWDAYFERELGAMIGGTVQLYRVADRATVAPAPADQLSFVLALPQASDWEARASFPPPALLRAQTLHQRTLAAIVLLGLLLALVPLLIVILGRRTEGATRTPWPESRAQAAGLEHFARLSHERSAELAVAQGARLRAEEDLQVNRHLLDQSVAARVRLGRELHDNTCQTLYAVCLTLESIQKKATLSPELGDRLTQCLAELRRVNQEVRAYLEDLEPGRVNGQSFAAALAGMIGSLPADAEVSIERRLDPATVELIPSPQVGEIMNILREAVSNSLRHGRARNIVLRAGQNDQAIALSVQDDGVGFSSGGRPGGHGLQNMRARAVALGGQLQVESLPGKGTRVVLTLPVPDLA